MSTSNGSQFRLEKLKKQAKSLSKKRGICSGQLIPDNKLSFSSATAGGNPWLY
ncbi:hypothetical protein CLV44_1162 [Marinobacterium halophilum]|uniref:Uncharacterized protein n=1 Tax=Marinobacterium halophilum TaxID=267374 RepID=A0A2P8ET65_9GAMM|nr:hypothetical protein CLV44_1162 [Marinobacterium halophilum]